MSKTEITLGKMTILEDCTFFLGGPSICEDQVDRKWLRGIPSPHSQPSKRVYLTQADLLPFHGSPPDSHGVPWTGLIGSPDHLKDAAERPGKNQ